jgi:hypothetical protein
MNKKVKHITVNKLVSSALRLDLIYTQFPRSQINNFLNLRVPQFSIRNRWALQKPSMGVSPEVTETVVQDLSLSS